MKIFVPPNYCFVVVVVTGELIGVEYLYAQTGQLLQRDKSSDEEDQDHEAPQQAPDADDEDEGFQVSMVVTLDLRKE